MGVADWIRKGRTLLWIEDITLVIFVTAIDYNFSGSIYTGLNPVSRPRNTKV